MVLAVAFLANPSSYTPQYKSDMRDIGAEMTPYLHPGDQVVVGQPEETPLAWYYLPGRPAVRQHRAGVVSDPRYMDWVKALHRLTNTNPQATLTPIVNALQPGQHLLFVRPLTEGAQNWEAPWTMMVRRRSAQWGAAAAGRRRPRDPAAGGRGAPLLPRRLLRGQQRRALPEGLLTVPARPARCALAADDHRHPATTASPRCSRSPRSSTSTRRAGSSGCPRWADDAARVLVLLMAISAFIRTRTLSGELWFNEAGAVGLASQPLGSLLGAVHRAGAAPLYYVLLHIWIEPVRLRARRATHAALAAARAGVDPGGDVDGVEPGRPPGRDLRRDPVRLQLVS